MSRPIVCVHGMWCTGASFARLAELLKPRGHVCHVPSLPAHEAGVAHPEVGDKSLTEYLSFLVDYVRAQGFAEAPIVLGHSMGGLLAQQLAAQIRPFALVLLNPVAPAGVSGTRLASLISFARTLRRWNWWRQPSKPSFGAAQRVLKGVPPEKVKAIHAGLVEESGRVTFEMMFWPLDRRRAARVDTSAIQCPVYVVSCGEDKLTPAPLVRKVAALYPHTSLRHYPDRGHWVIDDADTDEMATEIANWLQGHEHRVAALARE